MNKSLYKRGKFGCLPGDISKRAKIRMLEDKTGFDYFSRHHISVSNIVSYRNDHYKKLNRRFRKGNKVESDLIDPIV